MKRNEYDAIIIGFGKGGKTLAAKLGASGKKVALAEMDSDMYGGTCINVGCIPSKSLITSAAKADPHARGGESGGFSAGGLEEKRRLTAMLRKKNYDKLERMENAPCTMGMPVLWARIRWR